jgi:hypothetical protein
MFGKLPAQERERIIRDNRLCPFCLLHDRDAPCGAREKPVACREPGCKGRHIQRLHEFLKNVFQEESQVNVVQQGEQWEESEEAWELEEEEVVIVGTVQQEDGESWQEACKAWMEPEDYKEAGVCQVGICRQEESQEDTEDEWEGPGPDDLLIDEEAGGIILDLLLRSEVNHISSEISPEVRTTPTVSKKKRNAERRALKKERKETAQAGGRKAEAQKKDVTSTTQQERPGKTTAPDPSTDSEVKDEGLASEGKAAERARTGSTTTPRGECIRQKKPDS